MSAYLFDFQKLLNILETRIVQSLGQIIYELNIIVISFLK